MARHKWSSVSIATLISGPGPHIQKCKVCGCYRANAYGGGPLTYYESDGVTVRKSAGDCKPNKSK